MEDKVKGRIRLLCAGGCGINIGKSLEPLRGNSENGIGSIESVYIDTSHSNITSSIPEESLYLFKDLDGSGKIRRENYQQIAVHIRDILQKFPPLDLNILISSASGGSGSVVSPSLASELLEDDQPLIVIIVGSTDTRLDIDNTLKTIKSFEAISQLRKKPISIAYYQNSKDTPRAQVDGQILRLISSLLTLYSRENTELDSKDLFNFLRFDRVSSYSAQLARLEVYIQEPIENPDNNIISIASLYQPGQEQSLDFIPDYQCVGYLQDGVSERILDAAPIHLVNKSNFFPAIVKHLNGQLEILEKAQMARVSAGKILSDSDEATDSGLVF